LKYLKNKDSKKKYLDGYEKGLFEDKFLMEVILQLDPFKTISQRESTSFLDFLGDLGGFYQAIDILVFMIGQFFSAKFLMVSIAN
jgi:hypothetical protein